MSMETNSSRWRHKLAHEFKAMGLAMLYFGGWIGSLISFKHLILNENDD